MGNPQISALLHALIMIISDIANLICWMYLVYTCGDMVISDIANLICQKLSPFNIDIMFIGLFSYRISVEKILKQCSRIPNGQQSSHDTASRIVITSQGVVFLLSAFSCIHTQNYTSHSPPCPLSVPWPSGHHLLDKVAPNTKDGNYGGSPSDDSGSYCSAPCGFL